MQADLKGAKPELNIEILGVNRTNQAAYNQLVVSTMNPLPWLQDTIQDAVWSHWGVTYRDVRILDSQSRLRAVFNLTQFDLSVPGNYMTLRQMFLDAAKVVDSDGDGLPDDWEMQYFGNLLAGPGDDPDGDGQDNFTEFAFGTDPRDPKSFSSLQARLTSKGPDRFLTLSFRRPAGSIVDYLVEASPDLKVWTKDASELNGALSPRALFDGTGTIEAFWSLRKSTAVRPNGFLRVNASPKGRP